jgi:CRISPR-associated protein Csh1
MKPAFEWESDETLKRIGEWFREMGYSGHQQGLFLLGYLVGEVARAQHDKGDERRPILYRFDTSMGPGKIIALANQVLRSLRDHQLLNETNERIYHYATRLLNEHLDELGADHVRNAFYLASGYAFNAHIRLSRRA